MDNPDSPGDRPPRKELQGPRPTPLKVRKESHKIRKPPIPPPQQPPIQIQQQPQQQRQPVIIYTVSPKVIHAQPSEFMNLVQQLTGPNSTYSATTISSSSAPAAASSSSTAANYETSRGVMSPAARFAATEKTRTSPEAGKTTRTSGDGGGDFGCLELGDLGGGGMVGGRNIGNPGILSPGPGSLPPISPNFFPPLSDPNSLMMMMNLHQDHLNPVVQNQHGGTSSSGLVEGSSGNYVMPPNYTPSANLFYSPSTIISPASLDLLNEFLNN